MRVAYVCADAGVPVFGRKGCSIHVQEVVRALHSEGAEVDLFAACKGGPAPRGLEDVPLHALPAAADVDLVRREDQAFAANKALPAGLEAEGPFDLVYERYSLWSAAGMEYACEAGIPGLLEVNAPLIEEQAAHRGLVNRTRAEWIASRAFSSADALLAVSQEVAAWLRRHPSAPGRVYVVPNGVNPERFPPGLPPSRPSPPGVFTVGFVGTLKPWHGLSVLVEAFALFHAQWPASRLLVVGDGPQRGDLERALEAACLGGAAELTGGVSHQEVPGLLASMDAAVAPYPQSDSFYFSPLKVYEYQAAGLPVVASRVGQLADLVEDGATGLLVQPGDAAALARALDRLRRDPGLAARLGRAGRKRVAREHTWRAVAQRILSIGGLRPSATVAHLEERA